MFKLERCGLQHDWPSLYADPSGDRKQMETFVHCAADGGPKLSGARDVLVGQSLLGIFLLVPLFPAPANLFLGKLAHSVQGSQASKKTEAETKSRIQTLPKEESGT